MIATNRTAKWKDWMSRGSWDFATTSHLSHLCAFLWHSSWQLTRFWSSAKSQWSDFLPKSFTLSLCFIVCFFKALHTYTVSCTWKMAAWKPLTQTHKSGDECYRAAESPAPAATAVVVGHLKRLKHNTQGKANQIKEKQSTAKQSRVKHSMSLTASRTKSSRATYGRVNKCVTCPEPNLNWTAFRKSKP